MSRRNAPSDDSGGDFPVSSLKTIGAVLGGLLVVGIALNLLAAPLFQPLVYDLVHNSPIIVFWWVPTLILGAIVAFGGSYAGYENAPTYALYLVAGLFIISVVIVTPLSMAASEMHLADRTEDKMEVQTIDEGNSSLPNIDSENMRNVPLKKAKVDAENNFQASKFRVSEDADITYVDGEPYWSFALKPDSSGEEWSGAQNGSLFVSQTDSNGRVHIVQGDVKHGQGVKFWRSNKWHLQRTNYWVSYQDSFMSVSELPESGGTIKGETKIVRPIVKHEYHFKWGVIPYAVPKYAGAAVQDSDGNVEYLSPNEVRQNEELSDDNVYPYWLAKEEVKSLNWRQGIINKFWNKNGLFTLAEPSEDYGNSLPYVVQGEDGSKDYYIPVSPQGGGEGLKHLFIMDGQTGTLTQYKSGDTRMVGSQNVGKYVQGETPSGVTTWEEYQAVEPLPVVHDGQLYWQVRILSTTGTGMPGYAFINASQTSDIYFAMGDNKDELARQFASGEDIESNATAEVTDRTTTKDGTVVKRVVVKEDGEVIGEFNVTGEVSIEMDTVVKTNSTSTNSTAAGT